MAMWSCVSEQRAGCFALLLAWLLLLSPSRATTQQQQRSLVGGFLLVVGRWSLVVVVFHVAPSQPAQCGRAGQRALRLNSTSFGTWDWAFLRCRTLLEIVSDREWRCGRVCVAIASIAIPRVDTAAAEAVGRWLAGRMPHRPVRQSQLPQAPPPSQAAPSSPRPVVRRPQSRRSQAS